MRKLNIVPIANLRISLKLAVGFAGVLSIAMLTGLVLFSALRNVDQATRLNRISYLTSQDLDRALANFWEGAASSRAYPLALVDGIAKNYSDSAEAIRKNVALAREHAAGNPAILPLIDKFEETAFAWRAKIGDPLIKLAHDPQTMPQAMDLAKSRIGFPLVTAFVAASTAAQDKIGAWSADAQESQNQAIEWARAMQIFGLVSALFLSILVWLWLTRAIARPVGAMTSAMNRLAAGDNDIAIPAVGRRDELGLMAAAVMSFREAALDRSRIEREAIRIREQADGERARREAESAKVELASAQTIRGLGAGLDRLSDGDLVYRLMVPFEGPTDVMRVTFNTSIEKLQKVMSAIHAKTRAIQSGTVEITNAADDLSQRTEQQAAGLVETTAALNEISATVRQSARSAKEASDAVATAKAEAATGSTTVSRANDAMLRIEKSSDQIGQIIGVIDEIAFQTNLLALNAGVEAARAGEAGRGFAVVASEVRALAQRSADAAKEIKTLISVSSAQVGEGVRLVTETGSVLDRILNSVAGINAVVGTIAESAQHQATGLQEVSAAVTQMNNVTQKNAAMVEQTTLSTHSLAQETRELVELVAGFKVHATG